jgi:GT2 family glycosyltransferase
MPNVWIVVVNFNGTDDTRRCLRSLAGLSVTAKVAVIDNGSSPDQAEVIRSEFPWVHVTRNEENLGWSGGNNTGIRVALADSADFVLLLNNDTVVSPGIVARLLSAFAAYPRFGVIGPVIHYMDEPDAVMTDGMIFNPPGYLGFFKRKEVPEVVADPPRVEKTDIVNGCCMMVRCDVLRRVGLIDDRFFLIHEESDLCLRIKRAGLDCGILAEPLLWHKGSASFKRAGRAWQQYYHTRNVALLLSRHAKVNGRGLVASYFTYFRSVYHGYCHETAQGRPELVHAVLEGVIDAVMLRYGAYRVRKRWGVPVVRGIFAIGKYARRVIPRRER